MRRGAIVRLVTIGLLAAAAAFLKALKGEDILTESVQALEKQRTAFGAAYGDAPAYASMSVADQRGTLRDVIAFATSGG